MVIRLSPAIQKRVEREAKKRGITPSRYVEDFLKWYFAQPEMRKSFKNRKVAR